jgi:uncharacterized cupin superfamily protein
VYQVKHAKALMVSVAMLVIAAIVIVAHGDDKKQMEVPHGQLADFTWVSLPEFGGQEAIIYRSPDRTRVAAAFKESGKAVFTYPFDEFGYVTSGKATASVRGGPTLNLVKGDVFYFHEGMAVDLQMSDDFSDLTFLVSNHAVKWR